MKRALLLIATLFIIAGCSHLTTDLITENVKGAVNKVVNRHDIYVNAAPIAQVTKDQFLIESKKLTDFMLMETVPLADIAPPMESVCLRHNAYLEDDKTLEVYQKKYMKRSADVLLDIIEDWKSR